MPARCPSALLFALAGLAACNGPDYEEKEPANLVISSEFVEFGEISQGETVSRTITLSNTGQVNLGIESILLATETNEERGHPGSFSLSFDVGDITGGGSENGEAEAREDVAVDSGIDTGEDDTDVGDTDGEEPVEVPEGVLFELGQGARIPVTIDFHPLNPKDNYDAIIVKTKDGPEKDEDEKTIPVDERTYRDADETWQMVYLHGMAEETAANIVVTPKEVDFGFVWTGQTEVRYVAIKNVGDGPLTINDVRFDGTCEAFEITFAPAAGTIVEGDSATVVEVTYTPEEVDEAKCTMVVESDDLDAPEQEVNLKANFGTNPTNHSPYVKIISPETGYQHQGWGPIRMELLVNDPDQPAETLTCKVGSALQLGINITSCIPTTESGHFWVDVPVEDLLEAGLDVISVAVTDDSGVRRRDAISVLINDTYPDGDDDGDGFEAVSTNEDIPSDCDDTNAGTFPSGAEVYDSKDNDCDFRVDEGTDGADDDGDGMSEVAGDCDDNNTDTYRGAPEIQDSADNDCDAVIDEGTSVSDDDSDGFSELDLDCNDSDPTTNPSVLEICGDGLDNNCNGLKDSQEPCISDDSIPMLVGGINLAKTATEIEGSVQMSVFIYEADDDAVSHEWSAKDGEGTIDDPASPGITWTAPSALKNNDGDLYRLSYIGVDDDGNQVWDFAEVSVYGRGTLTQPILVPVEK
jgi:hypothetical protein